MKKAHILSNKHTTVQYHLIWWKYIEIHLAWMKITYCRYSTPVPVFHMSVNINQSVLVPMLTGLLLDCTSPNKLVFWQMGKTILRAGKNSTAINMIVLYLQYLANLCRKTNRKKENTVHSALNSDVLFLWTVFMWTISLSWYVLYPLPASYLNDHGLFCM